MRTGHRELDHPKGSLGDRAKKLGGLFAALAVMLMGMGVALGLGVAPLLSPTGIEPSSANAGESFSLEHGRDVLLTSAPT